MKKEFLDTLSKIELFKNIDKEILESEFSKIKYSIKTYQKYENIAFRGDEIKGLYINMSGSISAEMLKENGEIKKIENIEEAKILASAFIFGKFNQFPVDLIANEKTEVLYIEKKEFIKLLKLDDKILERFLNEISEKAQFLSKNLWESISNKKIDRKLAEYILANSSGDIFELKISVKELSEIFNVSRPSLSRVISQFIEKKILIKEGKGKYFISDKNILKKI